MKQFEIYLPFNMSIKSQLLVWEKTVMTQQLHAEKTNMSPVQISSNMLSTDAYILCICFAMLASLEISRIKYG